LRLQDAVFRAVNKLPGFRVLQHVSRCSAIEYRRRE
jgi:hypothetical protein